MSKSKEGASFFDNLKYVASSAFNPQNSSGSLSGSVLNLASMGTLGEEAKESDKDEDIVAGFFDFLIKNMPDNRDPDTILNVAKSITDFTSKDEEMENRWNNALDEYKDNGKHKDLAKELAEKLDKETAKEKEQEQEKKNSKERYDENGNLDEIKKDLKGLKLQQVNPGERPKSGAGMSAQKQQEKDKQNEGLE